MARSRYDWTQAKFERYVKEGRGKGSGKDYKPWITIQDFPSRGRVSRSLGWKSDRIHHFMSDWELRFFYLLEWSTTVQDIREQYPLLNLDLAFCIADELGIEYPREPKNNTPYCYYFINILKEKLINQKLKINTITTALDIELGFQTGTSLSLFKHLVARKEIIIDMLREKISSNSSANLIKKVI
ncbi:MAG: TnsA endonuclease C-terminal domain-containing protein [Waterburya sp.]